MKRFSHLLFLFSLCGLLACNDESPEEQPDTGGPLGDNVLLIGNEGGFTNENASVTLIDLDEGTAHQNAFSQANDGALLGDVLQSMTQVDDEIFLVVNNSDKIEVVGARDLVRKYTLSISGSSPRYMLPLSGDKAYVSDLFSPLLHVIDPETGNYGGTAPLGLAVDKMILHDGLVYATSEFADSLVAIDPDTDEVVWGMGIFGGPDDMVVDHAGRLWCMTNGTWDGSVVPSIHIIDIAEREVIRSFDFPEGTGYSGAMEISPDGEVVYILAGGDVYRMDAGDDFLPANTWIPSAGQLFYGLFVDEASGDVLITTSVDGMQGGKLNVYSTEGQLTATYAVGIFPGSALWIKP